MPRRLEGAAIGSREGLGHREAGWLAHLPLSHRAAKQWRWGSSAPGCAPATALLCCFTLGGTGDVTRSGAAVEAE